MPLPPALGPVCGVSAWGSGRLVRGRGLGRISGVGVRVAYAVVRGAGARREVSVLRGGCRGRVRYSVAHVGRWRTSADAGGDPPGKPSWLGPPSGAGYWSHAVDGLLAADGGS